MRVVQINTVCGYGSTGGICLDLANVLQQEGHECCIAYGQRTATYENSYKIGTITENHLHNAYSRLAGRQGYCTTSGTRKLIRFLEEKNPEVIHLHNLHGNYLNVGLLFHYLSHANKAVVWTLHDCWAFTGKCAHYTDAACYKWQTHCHQCPQVHQYPPSLFFDFSKEMYADKKSWFTSVSNLSVITVSHWLEGEVKQSFLQKYPVQTIYNWIDHALFRPTASNIKAELGIAEKQFVAVSVSNGWDQSNDKFKDILQLAYRAGADMQFIIIGNAKTTLSLPGNVRHIPYIDSKEGLAKLYSMADAYVHLSTQDTFGKVIGEAMSCGTPAVVYNSTACPELIGEGCGYVVSKRDTQAMYEALLLIKANGKAGYSDQCIRHVKNNFDFNKNIHDTIALYQRISGLW